jgi:hypothetical protein
MSRIDCEDVDVIEEDERYEGEVRYTCEKCRRRGICLYSYDLYCTDGDCLFQK